MGRALYRLGGYCARHRTPIVVLWVLAAISIVGFTSVVGAETNNALNLPGTGSQAAYDLLASRFPPQQNGTSPFLFHVDDGTLSSPKYKPAMDATYEAIKSVPAVFSVVNPVSKKGMQAGIISAAGTTGFMPVLLRVNSGYITEDLANKVLAATAPARKAGIVVAVGGPIGSELSMPETKTSEILGNIAAMIVLALVFGSFIAMGMPIVTAIVALSVTTSLIGLLGHFISVPTVSPTLAVMIGLGVGIDYALFMITKHKELLADGVEMRESIARSVASSGSAIVFAGSTVVIALLSLTVAGIPLVSTIGLASAIAVVFAVLTSLTLLPAFLSLIGSGVDRLRIPSFLHLSPRPPGERRWDAWARGVGRHPWLAVALALLVLAPLIMPLLSLRLGQADVGVSPTSTTQRQAYDLMTAGFGVGYNGPLLIAMSLSPDATPSAAYTKKYDEATELQRELKMEQKRLTREAAALQRQQAQLEKQAAELQREQAALLHQKQQLERQKAGLERQEAQLRAQAVHLAELAKPLIARLVFINARERIVRRKIAHTTDPDELRRLLRRLARLQDREARVRARLEPLVQQGRTLLVEAEQLRAQAEALQQQADELQAQAIALQKQADALARKGAKLQERADRLRAEKQQALQKKQRAEKLKKQLTAMLTQAGGDARGTDPRIVDVQNAALATDGVVGLLPLRINDKGDAATVSAIPLRAPSSPATAALVRTLRDPVLSDATEEGGIEVYVGGTTAASVDLAAKIARRLPIVVVTVIALSFILLMVAFRSLVIPLQAAVVNLLTVAAALGVLTAVFQWGWGLSLIRLDAPNGSVPIASYVPLMMFAVLFGLSMDYEVFLVSRIEQHHDAGESPRDAVTSGLGGAAHVVVAAALIMFLVFASFIINGDPTVKQFGVGLAAAVFLAGTMIVLLAPAILMLFGDRTFWVPAWLGRLLPHLDIEGGVADDTSP